MTLRPGIGGAAVVLPLRAVVKGTMPRHLLSRRRHTHHALDNAVEQAELLANLMAWPGPEPAPGA